MKVVHFQRKPVSERYFSIENYFISVRKELEILEVDVTVEVCSYISQGFFKRLYNTIEAFFRQRDVNHITGDVHYLNLLFHKKRSILTIQDCVFMKHPSPLARMVLKLFWLTIPSKRAIYITCTSEATREELKKYISLPSEQISIIPIVANEQQFTFSPKEFESSCPSILFIGTTPNKNLERVAEALNGITCKLEIVGPLSVDQKAALEKNNVNYRNEVRITDQRMTEKYRECDILLFPSTYEGFGMPILEAQLTGRPVITSNYSSMPEVASDSACLINPFEVASIRNGVKKVIENPSFRVELIKKGTQNVKRFSARRVAEMYQELYDKIYSSH